MVKPADPFISIVDFDKQQHYKDRSPIWIKLYSNLWDNHHFESLPDETKAHYLGLCVLASKHDNRIPYEPEWIARKIGSNKVIDFQSLFASGLLARSRKVALAKPEQCASPEKEKEKTREEKENMGPRKTRAPETMLVTPPMMEWLAANRITADPEIETAHMLDHFRSKGESRLDWPATWRNWMRNSKKFNRNGGSDGQPKSRADVNREIAEDLLRDLENKRSLQRAAAAGNSGHLRE